MKKLIQELRSKSISTRLYSEMKSVDLPNNAGKIIRLRDNPRSNEGEIGRNKRHQEFVRDYLRDDCFTILVSPTLINATDEDTMNRIVQKIVSGKNISPEESGCLIPGHISVHTPSQFLSHRNPRAQSSNPLERDVNDTMKPCYDTYIAIFPKKNFPKSSLEKKPGPFNISAIDNGDNCSTATQKALLDKKDRKKMNPLATLHIIADAAVIHTNPAEEQYDQATMLLSEIGVNRGLVAVAKDYQNELSAVSKTQQNPLSGVNSTTTEQSFVETRSENIEHTQSPPENNQPSHSPK